MPGLRGVRPEPDGLVIILHGLFELTVEYVLIAIPDNGLDITRALDNITIVDSIVICPKISNQEWEQLCKG